MKRQLLASALALAAMAAQGADKADAYFATATPKLNPQEKAALAIAQKWQAPDADAIKPLPGPQGGVQFMYGVQQVNVVCAVLQICDIELQPGEQVNNLNIGDPRFTVEPAVSGSAVGDIVHLIIKPLDVGLQSTAVVTTNRRTYHLNLRSHRSEFMPRIAFTYPEEAMAKWEAAKAKEVKEREARTLPETKEYLGDLDFRYSVSGTAAWKPVRVYNDGVKTVIQVPKAMSQTDAPALLLLRKEGGLFKDEEVAQVNYRLQGDRYIVDAVFDKGILISGVGRSQDRVTITREK